MLRNPDHVTVAVADAPAAIAFFELLGFRDVAAYTENPIAGARFLELEF